MIAKYLYTVRRALLSAIITAGIMTSISLMSLMAPLIFLVSIIPFSLSFRFFQEKQMPMSINFVISFALGAAAILLFPQIFLFFNALPLAASMTFVSLSTLFLSFETMVYHPRLELGHDYSLLKLMLSPRTSILRLRELLHINEPINRAEERAREEREMLRQHDEELLWIAQQRDEERNRVTSMPPAQQRRRPQRAQTEEGLRLPETDRRALVERQTAAINALEKGAIIDDVALYKKHLALLQTKRGRDAILNASETSTIADQALENTKAEAKNLEDAYISTLANAEQVENYRNYRELTRNISPPYAECTLSAEAITSGISANFVVFEKRDTATWKCIKASTRFWHFQNGYRQIFRVQDHLNRPIPPQEPTKRDPLFNPINEAGKTADYYFYTYQVIRDHGLSLELCETIEKLNLSLKAVPKRNPAKNANNTNGVDEYLINPRRNQGLLSELSIFSENNEHRIELDPDLEDYLTEEEKLFVRCGRP